MSFDSLDNYCVSVIIIAMTQQQEIKEVWVPAHGKWETIYEVSSLGHVRRIGEERLLKASSAGKNGRFQIKLYEIGGMERINVMLSHLVLSSFRHEDVAGRRIEHQDGNSKNCALDNLYFINRRHPTSKYGNNHGGRKESSVAISDFSALIINIFTELMPETQKLLKRK